MKYINLIEKNVNNAIIIYGFVGKRVYYYYTKTQAIKRYIKECKKELNYD